jgi:hypothetical protein
VASGVSGEDRGRDRRDLGEDEDVDDDEEQENGEVLSGTLKIVPSCKLLIVAKKNWERTLIAAAATTL